MLATSLAKTQLPNCLIDRRIKRMTAAPSKMLCCSSWAANSNRAMTTKKSCASAMSNILDLTNSLRQKLLQTWRQSEKRRLSRCGTCCRFSWSCKVRRGTRRLKRRERLLRRLLLTRLNGRKTWRSNGWTLSQRTRPIRETSKSRLLKGIATFCALLAARSLSPAKTDILTQEKPQNT